MARGSRGFTLLETLIALSLVSVSMTGLVVAVGSSSKFGALARRQATAMAVARSQAEALSHAQYPDPVNGIVTVLSDTNTGNNGDDAFGDPAGLFAKATLPTAANAPDASLGTVQVGTESYAVYANVRPVADPGGVFANQGTQIAVIVRYKIGAQWMRAVAIAYRYNPTAVGIADGLPL